MFWKIELKIKLIVGRKIDGLRIITGVINNVLLMGQYLTCIVKNNVTTYSILNT